MPDQHAAPPATAVVVRQKDAYSAIEAKIREREGDIVNVLAKGLDKDRFLHLALAAVTRQPRLLDCTPASFVLALREAAELGLYPSGLMATGYLVPYKNRKTNRYEAKFIPGYRGLIELARNSGDLRTIEARCVRANDRFEFERGTNGFVRHVPLIPGINGAPADADPGKYVGVWFRALLRSGDDVIDVMTTAEVDDVRRRSKASDDGPWVTDWPMMAAKTIVRRNSRFLPMSTSLQRALELEEVAENEAAAPDAHVAPVPPAVARLRAHAGVAQPAEGPYHEPDEPLDPEIEAIFASEGPGDASDGGKGAES